MSLNEKKKIINAHISKHNMSDYFKIFDNEVSYTNFKTSDNYIEPNVSLIEEDYTLKFNPYYPPLQTTVGDIIYWDGTELKAINKDNYTTSLGTAVGATVIPTGFAPDGKARMIGLKPLDASGNPSNSHIDMTWSVSGTDTSLTNYTKVPTTDNAGSTSTGSNNYGYLPSDKFTGATSYIDSGAQYSGTTNLIPSPYLYNGEELIFNPEYSKAIEGNNALSDFNGLSNTETLVGLGTGYKAANAAWKYSDGVSNTQWYLPSIGELGFLMPRFNEINNAITKAGGVAVDSSYGFWSSSEYSSDSAYSLFTPNGGVGIDYKNDGYYVRAFSLV